MFHYTITFNKYLGKLHMLTLINIVAMEVTRECLQIENFIDENDQEIRHRIIS